MFRYRLIAADPHDRASLSRISMPITWVPSSRAVRREEAASCRKRASRYRSALALPPVPNRVENVIARANPASVKLSSEIANAR